MRRNILGVCLDLRVSLIYTSAVADVLERRFAICMGSTAATLAAASRLAVQGAQDTGGTKVRYMPLGRRTPNAGVLHENTVSKKDHTCFVRPLDSVCSLLTSSSHPLLCGDGSVARVYNVEKRVVLKNAIAEKCVCLRLGRYVHQGLRIPRFRCQAGCHAVHI